MNISLFLSCPDYFFCKFPVVGFTLRKTDGFTLRKFAGAKLLITTLKGLKAPKGRKDYRRGCNPRYWIPKCTEALKGRKIFRAFSTPLLGTNINGGFTPACGLVSLSGLDLSRQTELFPPKISSKISCASNTLRMYVRTGGFSAKFFFLYF